MFFAAVWARFSAEMRDDRGEQWLANYGKVADDWYPDLGYFVGARICEAYSARAKDKQQAVKALLLVTDPFAILKMSGYADQFP